MKEAVDMSPEEYRKFIFQSGVKDYHGGGKIVKMNADGGAKMPTRKKIAIGILVGLPVIGVVAPLLMKGTKDEKILLSIFGGVFGLILGAGLSVMITPSPEKIIK